MRSLVAATQHIFASLLLKEKQIGSIFTKEAMRSPFLEQLQQLKRPLIKEDSNVIQISVPGG